MNEAVSEVCLLKLLYGQKSANVIKCWYVTIDVTYSSRTLIPFRREHGLIIQTHVTYKNEWKWASCEKHCSHPVNEMVPARQRTAFYVLESPTPMYLMFYDVIFDSPHWSHAHRWWWLIDKRNTHETRGAHGDALWRHFPANVIITLCVCWVID